MKNFKIDIQCLHFSHNFSFILITENEKGSLNQKFWNPLVKGKKEVKKLKKYLGKKKMVKTLQSCVPFNLSSKLKDYDYEKCSGYEAVVYHDGNVDYVLLSIDYGRDVRYYVLNAGAVIMRDDYYEKVEISFDEKTETVEKKTNVRN
jgi:hypothetical protein